MLCLLGAILLVFFLIPSKDTKATTNWLEGLDVLCGPNGITPTKDGGFLITDAYGKLIWRAEGNHAEVYAGAESVKDIYGEAIGGYNDASLAESLFKEPWAIVPFLDGYAVSDTGNHAVRLIDKDSVQTVNGYSDTLEMGDLGVTFDTPTGLAVDEAGNLYVADTARGAIYVISTEGDVNVFVDQLNSPMGLCWFNGALYVAETEEHRILKSENGAQTVVAGTGEEGHDDGAVATATFSHPQGVAVAPDGTVYVADTVNASVRRIENGTVDTILSPDDANLTTYPTSPVGMCVNGGFLYVCDHFSRRVYVLPL